MERQSSRNKRERQPISVPFLWEEKPGTPKKDWKPFANKVMINMPTKLVVSVPFVWEEKPGRPLTEGFLLPPPAPAEVIDDHEEVLDASSDSDMETESFETNDSFSSAPSSLLANRLMPSMELARAVPVEKMLIVAAGTEADSPAVSETGSSSASSYETGSTSLVGASFLEWLFPLLVSSKSNARGTSPEYAQQSCTDFQRERSCRRPLLTLGEMIEMSRRRSYQRKTINMCKKTSMDCMKRKRNLSSFGCMKGNFFAGSEIGVALVGLHKKWKRSLPLKLN